MVDHWQDLHHSMNLKGLSFVAIHVTCIRILQKCVPYVRLYVWPAPMRQFIRQNDQLNP